MGDIVWFYTDKNDVAIKRRDNYRSKVFGDKGKKSR
jgi:hypothetical protein